MRPEEYRRLKLEDILKDLMRLGITKEQIEEQKRYTFEVTCQEAEYLDLRRKSYSNKDYYKLVAKMAIVNTRSGFEELHRLVTEMRRTQGLGRLKLDFDYKGIPKRIREQYKRK